MSENTPHVELPNPAQVEIFRRMPPAKRVAAALRMTRIVRQMVETQIRSAHPDWSDEQVGEGIRSRLHARRG